jgi:hypothetical protein
VDVPTSKPSKPAGLSKKKERRNKQDLRCNSNPYRKRTHQNQ